MTPKQYRDALAAIGLNVNNAAKVIGKSPRTSRVYAKIGVNDPTVARLLRLIRNMQLVYNDALEHLMTH